MESASYVVQLIESNDPNPYKHFRAYSDAASFAMIGFNLERPPSQYLARSHTRDAPQSY